MFCGLLYIEDSFGREAFSMKFQTFHWHFLKSIAYIFIDGNKE